MHAAEQFPTHSETVTCQRCTSSQQEELKAEKKKKKTTRYAGDKETEKKQLTDYEFYE